MLDRFERAGLVVELVAVTVPTNPMQAPPRRPTQSLGREASCALNRRSENVLVIPVIIAELELGDIQMQLLFADLVESADAAALDERPEAFDGLSVDRADYVLLFVMVNRLVGVFLAERFIAGPFEGRFAETALEPGAYEHAAVLAPVKERPGHVAVYRAVCATAVLDRRSTRQPRERAGRDEKMSTAEPKDGLKKEDRMPST
jgi:hypothetical protein